jgi:ATP-binding cassette subfamily B protein
LIAGGGSGLTIGTLVAFTTVQLLAFSALARLLSSGAGVQTSLALLERIFEYLDLRPEIEERADAVRLPPAPGGGEVILDGVSFRYQGAAASTLSGVSFRAPPGSRTAIVGETGSGKTTLGYLVARLYDVQAGRVLIDGVDVRDLSFATIAECVGYVSQETFLFHASVRDNVRLAKPDASDHEIESAARVAQIHETVASLPAGYETIVGERGHRFSGGERQRIAIARAVLSDPRVLVLDEATSALDAVTEREIQEALDRLSEGRTTIAIAHRLSTVRDADQILVLDHGRVVEIGTHGELIEADGRYAQLVASDVLVG